MQVLLNSYGETLNTSCESEGKNLLVAYIVFTNYSMTSISFCVRNKGMEVLVTEDYVECRINYLYVECSFIIFFKEIAIILSM